MKQYKVKRAMIKLNKRIKENFFCLNEPVGGKDLVCARRDAIGSGWFIKYSFVWSN
jgi:hypothetical protein